MLKKPAENTVESFCELVATEVSAREWRNIRAAAIAIRIAPKSLYEIVLRRNIGKPSSTTRFALEKWQSGRIFVISAICETLGLDLSSCLKACGLPADNAFVQQQVKPRTNKFTIGLEDLDGLKKAIELFGPIAQEDLSRILAMLRQSK